ncbi:hypothetical protein LCGC14_2256130 [marine sediment metagenome]|uniref:Uncharacterized protein n=1 Tax=marine sediment metagenome TaxID=412755 RepID=A0A0F9FW64_9ZZZZ
MVSSILNQKLSDLSKLELLDRATQFIFSTGLNDGTSKLCRANMKYGLTQFHLIQEKYGFEPRATFISSPDETISRNRYRWNSGLGYGGRLNWGSGREKLIFLNVKPNCCGILVGGLEELPDPYDLIKKIDKIKSREIYHNEILLNWDYSVSNHFINCFETKNLSDIKLPPYIFLIHGSTPEFRDDKYGLGLYIDSSKALKNIAIEEVSRFGTQYIVIDSDAKDYLDFNLRALEFSNTKREIIAKNLFDYGFDIICNQPHQFLKDYNNMYLGSNCTDESCDLIKTNIFPLTLRADISAYLFSGKRNLSEITLRNQDFYERARDLELLELLTNACILPHGGGYNFADIKDVIDILEYKDQRYFVTSLKTNISRLKIIRNVNEMQFEYRGRDVVLKTIQLDLGSIIARLNPLFSLKL